MDLVSGLTAARLAFDLVKDLKSIDKSVDDAVFKMKIAELMSALADTQVALSDAKTRLSELEGQLLDYKIGSICPKCRDGRLQVQEVETAAMTTDYEIHKVSCSTVGCGYVSKRRFNRNTQKYAGT
jgi:hypothetical protein